MKENFVYVVSSKDIKDNTISIHQTKAGAIERAKLWCGEYMEDNHNTLKLGQTFEMKEITIDSFESFIEVFRNDVEEFSVQVKAQTLWD